MNKTKVIKASGEEAFFEIKKLINSLKRAGASERIARQIASEIKATLRDGMRTKEIYKIAFSKLRKHSRPTAARYKLKKAIMELGSSGYPFEKFVAALLASEGFSTRVGVFVQGHCVVHEIDVIAQNDKHQYMCECKFHNRQGRTCDVKIPLYIQSRFKDVEKTWLKSTAQKDKFHQGWIFTNTRFTTDAQAYGECAGLKLISWDYPKGEGIKDRVDRHGIHPVTSLTTLSLKEKKELVKLQIILCRDLCNTAQSLKKIGISKNRQKNILKEAGDLCQLN